MKTVLLMAAGLLFAGGNAAADVVVDWREAAGHYGRYMAVEGRIVAAKCLPKVCFLNFGRKYKEDFTAVIFAGDLPKFPANPDTFYLGKDVRVYGVIKKYKGKPEVILEEPSQIDIVKQ